MLIGKSASYGIGIAKALVIENTIIKLETEKAQDIAFEINRFDNALKEAVLELNQLYQKTLITLGEDKAQIFEAHTMILQDPELIDSIHDEIKNQSAMASAAVDTVAKTFIDMFEGMDNEYMRERALDIKDVSLRIIRKILKIDAVNLSDLKEDAILIANDITPSQMASIDLKKTIGIITETGGKTSHTAIMARTMELPAVVGLKDALKSIKSGDLLIIDGETGEVFVSPDKATLSLYEERRNRIARLKLEMQSYRDLDAVTPDKRRIHLEANIASPLDLDSVLRNGAEGIGLFRTEFIYMDRDKAPTEEEQFTIYKKVLEGMGQKPVVIRTLDVGGDKHLAYLKIPKEENPFLGFRAIRYCLQDKPLFKTQLRALLRSSVFGHLSIMFPMISGLEEIEASKKLLDECREELLQEGIPFAPKIKVGIMIEIPSAAIMADLLAEHVDFFSIGTNDLIQYVCAVDRMNENIHSLYDPFHPGVLRLINMVIKAGEARGIEVAMCGEMAANEALTEILLGMGLTHFSMAPGSILKTKKMVREISFEKSQALAKKILTLPSAKAIKDYLKSLS
jgi:phosphoenolpyruvate-protein phosphotransferase (PTS system enzyme I)